MARQKPGFRSTQTPRPTSDPLDGAIGMMPSSVFGDPGALPLTLSAVLCDLDPAVTSVVVCRAIVANLPYAPDYLCRALVDVGAAADASGLANAYHNPAHSRDVGIIFANLMRLQAFLQQRSEMPDDTDFLIGCCAAFGHDIGHDGHDGGPPFRLERIAADRVGAILDHHTVDPHLIERVYGAIMSTEVTSGYRALDEAGRGPLSSDVPECLLGLAVRKNREAACLLRDADVMQSAGLTPEDHDRQTARLEEERGIPKHSMGVRGADFFLKDLIRGRFLSEAGRVFQPRLDHLLELNDRRARKGAVANGLAAFDG